MAREVTTIKELSDRKSLNLRRKPKELASAISRMTKELASKPFEDTKVVGDGTIPNGKIVMKMSGMCSDLKKVEMQVPVWEWDGVHPDVPTIDPHYIYREDLLVKALYAIIGNQRMYLQGHAGAE